MTKTSEPRNELQMTPEQKRKVALVSGEDLKKINGTILENASSEWSKVSRIVLTTMIERDEGVTGLPEGFYYERIADLVKEGSLEARGDLSSMRTAEVRLTGKK
jgi:hypothetical protein